MGEHIDDIKKELEEVRRLKEELKKEIEATRDEREDSLRQRAEASRRRDTVRSRPPRPPRSPHGVPPVPPVRDLDIDLSGITDSLEDMMDGLGRSIEMSIQDIDGIGKSFRIPGIRIYKNGRKSRKVRKSEIERIPPERVAKIVAPLGSEERLKILDYLKQGGKKFNEIEEYTGKTGSSLTHHLDPLIEAGYVVKGEVRGTYYVTVEGRLAYRLAQWLTHRVEKQREQTASNKSNGSQEATDFQDDDDVEHEITVEDANDLEAAQEHLERAASELEKAQGSVEELSDQVEDAIDEMDDEDEDDDDDNIDSFDWKD